MTGLEIALFILGAAFIIISFFIVDGGNNARKGPGQSETSITGEVLRRIGADTIEDLNHKSDLLIAESEDKLEAISNDKIIAVGEYSDQILEKINSNHKEVVFLYQMLNDKEDELKATASKLENVRIECEKLLKTKAALDEKAAAAARADAAGVNGVVGVQGVTGVPGIPGVTGVTRVSGASSVSGMNGAAGVSETTGVSGVTGVPGVTGVTTRQASNTDNNTDTVQKKTVPQEKKPVSASVTAAEGTTVAKGRRSTSAGASSATAASAAKGTVRKTPSQPVVTKPIEAEGRDNQSLSRNEEVISLYRQGRSVMEISKLLGMGQGEVRLIINLYG
ncbi:MAG: helix-turn-helix domain containing protein [Lachnospiraceae bacterium]|nr:helix-turn-helix domain containing protein [Lachnospiraceae bacterium]